MESMIEDLSIYMQGKLSEIAVLSMKPKINPKVIITEIYAKNLVKNIFDTFNYILYYKGIKLSLLMKIRECMKMQYKYPIGSDIVRRIQRWKKDDFSDLSRSLSDDANDPDIVKDWTTYYPEGLVWLLGDYDRYRSELAVAYGVSNIDDIIELRRKNEELADKIEQNIYDYQETIADLIIY